MSNLSALSTEQLADAFSELSRQQGKAVEDENTPLYNHLFGKLRAITDELRARGTDARKVLIPFLAASKKEPAWSYESAQIRFNAAVELEAVVPELARATLQWLASSGPQMYRGMAGMSLSLSDQGIYKPT